MCGIAGIVGRALQVDAVEKALRAIRHRGPDGHGVCVDEDACLIHTRLSIIDLSEAAGQPMRDQSTGVSIVYNGEIYNYRELRAAMQGEPFSSQSDTEVILRLYLKYGMSCVNMLRGMFAFAIWDPRFRTLHLCRDRFGIKPLYYYCDGGAVIFASEIKGLIALGVSVSLNLSMVYDYLKFGRTAHTSETFFNPVRSLEPGSILSFQEGKTRATTYWSLPSGGEPEDKSDEDIEEEVWELLQETIKLHMVGDVPVGISLSSGLDSQFIVSLLSGIAEYQLHSFTFGYEEQEYDEIIRVQKSKFGLPLIQHYLRTRPEQMLESLKSAIYYFEAPLGGLGTLSAYQLMQLVRDIGIKVLLSGEGADETFGGYKYYYYAYFRDLYEGGQISVLQRELDGFWRTNGDELKIGSADFQKLVLNDTASVRAPDGTSLGEKGFLGPLLLESESESRQRRNGTDTTRKGSHLRRVMLDDLTRLKLPKLLWFQDRASMAWGIETRVPFLDHRLVEFIYRLSPRWIIRNGVSKYLAKRLQQRFKGLGSASGVKHYVATPQREWLKGSLYDTVNRHLDEGCLVKSGLVDYKGWKRAYVEYAGSPALGNSFFVWKMINLEGLLQQFLGGKV